MRSAKSILLEFYAIARQKGYTQKIVGDIAFRNRNGDIIRFVSGKYGALTYAEVMWNQKAVYHKSK